jgi:hypothetical protein
MSKVFASLLMTAVLVGCGKAVPSDLAQNEPETLRCSAYGGLEDRVCPASIYAIVASPSKYYGRTVAFRGFVHQSQDGTISIYPSKESALGSETASSIVCASSKESCDKFVGTYAEVFGVLNAATTLDSLFKPVGTIELVHVRSFK